MPEKITPEESIFDLAEEGDILTIKYRIEETLEGFVKRGDEIPHIKNDITEFARGMSKNKKLPKTNISFNKILNAVLSPLEYTNFKQHIPELRELAMTEFHRDENRSIEEILIETKKISEKQRPMMKAVSNFLSLFKKTNKVAVCNNFEDTTENCSISMISKRKTKPSCYL